jgi:hypothetical protein
MWRLFRYFFIVPVLNYGLESLYSIAERKTKLKELKTSICETVMKNRFIFPSEARLVRFKDVNSGNINALSEVNLAIRPLAIILSSKDLNQAGYL